MYIISFDFKPHIGEIHGIYKIVDVSDTRDKWGHLIYKCICTECGRIKLCSYSSISCPSKIKKKCNHKRANGDLIPYTNRNWNNKRIGRIFRGMIRRCYSKNCREYRWYGAREIGIYSDWMSNPFKFEEWALSNGYTDDLTIDRIDPNKDYCPENCRWVTASDNSKNKPSDRIIIVDGISNTGRGWAKECKIGCNTINKMLSKYKENVVISFIKARLKNIDRTRNNNQTWLSVYGIQS